MAAVSITVDLLRGSIPEACYREGDEVNAAIVLIEGLDVLRMTIDEIVTGTGDTDEVTFTYEFTSLPAGIELLACHLSSFQCVCDCCAERTCYEIIGPTTSVIDGTYHVGFFPGDTQIDQFRFYSPTPGSEPLLVTITVGGVNVVTDFSVENATQIDRTDFLAYTDGRFPADAEITVTITTPSGYVYEGGWLGLSLCVLGLRYTEVKVNSTFDFVVDSYAELLLASEGSWFFEYPFLYVMAPWGVAQVPLNTTFTPPS